MYNNSNNNHEIHTNSIHQIKTIKSIQIQIQQISNQNNTLTSKLHQTYNRVFVSKTELIDQLMELQDMKIEYSNSKIQEVILTQIINSI